MMDSRLIVTVVMATAMFLGARNEELDYSCNPSGSITVNNPDADTYIGAFSKTADDMMNCTTYVVRSMGVIMISDCPTSRNISLYLMQTSELPTIITDDIQFNTIRCQQLPATGAMRKVTDQSWVTNFMPSTSTEATVTPRIILNTQIEDIESGIKRETAIVGEPLIWDIEGPEGYILLPENCTVTSGAGGDAIVMVINGCSLDTYLLDHFDYRSETEKHILEAKLYAFRFADSEEVVIECDMIGCVNTSTYCDFTCTSDKRRRRNIFDDHVQDLMERQSAGRPAHHTARAQELYGDRSSDSSNLVGQVHTSLRVFGLEDIVLNAGSTCSAGWSSRIFITVPIILGVFTYSIC